MAFREVDGVAGGGLRTAVVFPGDGDQSKRVDGCCARDGEEAAAPDP